jgi:serine/threonine protein kinase
LLHATQGGELFNLLGQYESLPVPHAKFYAACVLSGLAHLHSLHIVYRDLKVSTPALAGREEVVTSPPAVALEASVIHSHPRWPSLTRVRVSALRLQPENLLIDRDGYIRIVDFGFAKHVPASERTYTLCGTPEYLAPEISE